jgi:tetratricopeptide (TPR) repeat protein
VLVTSASLLFVPGISSGPRIIGAVGVCTSIVALWFTTDSFRRLLNQEAFSNEIGRGKTCLSEGNFVGAALAFQKAVAYRDSWQAHYGLAYALEALGHVDEAVWEYRSAKFIAYGCKKPILAITTSQYVRVLMRQGTTEGGQLALKAADDALFHLKGESGIDVDEIKLGRGFVLMALGRDEEARQQFEELAHSKHDETIRHSAESGVTAAGLIELAKSGPETFFAMFSKSSDKIQ